ncbi:hypothetical protein L598_000200001400 [Mesorhizobium sp. J18]|uniref:hypothetical protein n=1 Tax=Mesorhizobium sp. J18 TaxID=935263 RepID=UPI00119B9F7D|nr:hypothetical protein [Mesorhizobium sp. J18]TWG98001.1 hypothetical protein L598_000200001400 [Mesorhizobium sp. J18]
MKSFLIASVAVLGLTGIAAAQEAPVYVGNYDAAVEQSLNNDNAPRADGVDLVTTHTVRSDRGIGAGSSVQSNPVHSENYGR